MSVTAAQFISTKVKQRDSQQAVQTESRPLMILQQSWALPEYRVRAGTWRLCFLPVEFGLWPAGKKLQCCLFAVCFQALGSDSEESKKVNVEEDPDQDITDDSGSD